MNKIIVIGHLNPDTDTVASSIGLAELLNKEGQEAQAFKKGNLNQESRWALDFCNLKERIEELPETNLIDEKVFFVDFNEESQSPINMDKIRVEGIIDHHKFVPSFKTEEPKLIRIEPVGSTSTLVLKLAAEKRIELSLEIKKILLCGILSDTLNLSSPTTTKQEVDWVFKLKNELGVDPNEIADKLFEAKSDLSAFSPREIVKLDWKNFDFGSLQVGIGAVETVKPELVKKNENELRKALEEIKNEESLDLAYLGIVDILKNQTEMIILSEKEKEGIMKTFSDIIINGENLILRGIVSRKKQIVPALEAALKQ